MEDYTTMKTMTEEDAKAAGLYEVIGAEVDDAYIAELKKQVLHKDAIEAAGKDLKIVYTPLHGTGNIPARRILKELGFENVYVVKEQELPDGDFPTVSYPNPEAEEAFELGLKLAKEIDADIVLATDPDADRLGVRVKDKDMNFVFGVFATRVMIRGAAAIKALRNPWLYGAAKPGQEKAEKKPVDFVSLRKKFLTFSACLMAAILLCAAVFGVHLDTEFTGGAMITLSYEGSFDQSAVQKTAAAALENTGLTLQTGENVATGDQTLKISMPGTETVTTEQVENLLDSLNENYPDNQFAQLSLSNVSAAMGTKFLQKSLVAVVFALVLILLYIALRFKNIGGLTGGMMAVLALVNDLMVVFGTFVLLRTALDGNFIAAMLTILGYSINDTVVVYDRIRENRTLMGKKGSFEELVNQSVNQSARRTLITTITTVMALGVMCIVAKLYGLDSIFTFAFPLMMGMISGVYTSLCVSTSAWVLWSERSKKKN